MSTSHNPGEFERFARGESLLQARYSTERHTALLAIESNIIAGIADYVECPEGGYAMVYIAGKDQDGWHYKYESDIPRSVTTLRKTRGLQSEAIIFIDGAADEQGNAHEGFIRWESTEDLGDIRLKLFGGVALSEVVLEDDAAYTNHKNNVLIASEVSAMVDERVDGLLKECKAVFSEPQIPKKRPSIAMRAINALLYGVTGDEYYKS